MQEKEESCVFCKIAKGEVNDFKLWEDENFVLFLDKNPVKEGHCLLIPKIHFENIYDMDEKLMNRMFGFAKMFSKPIISAFNAKKMGMLIKGFSVPHAHLHLIPLSKEGEDMQESKIESAQNLERIRIILKKEIEKNINQDLL